MIGIANAIGTSLTGKDTNPVVNGLNVMLLADKSVQVDGSNNVTQWTDLSGNDNHAVKDASFAAMTYDGESVNGTDSGNERLIIGSAGDFAFLNDGTGGTCFVMANYEGNRGDGVTPLWSNKTASGTAAGIYFAIDDATEQENILIQVGNGTSQMNTERLGNYTAIPDVDTIYTYRCDDSATNDFDIEQDETVAGSFTAGNTFPSTCQSPFTLNAISGSSFANNASYKAVLIYDRRLTDTECEQVRDWLSKRFRYERHLSGYIRTQSSIQAGDDVQAALDAVGDRTSNNMHRFLLADGNHDVMQLENDFYQVLQGQSRANTVLRMLQPDATSAANITNRSTVEWKDTSVIRRMTVQCENARYALHPEVNNGVTGIRLLGEDLTVTHLGNPSSNNTWGQVNQAAIGSGTRTGTFILIDNCELNAPERPFSTHNNINFDKSSRYIVKDSDLNTTVATETQSPQAQAQVIGGSGVERKCTLDLINCTGTGYLQHTYTDANYDLTPAEAQVFSDYSFDLTGTDLWYEGNNPVTSQRFRQEALRINSDSTNNTDSVIVTGDMTLFGNEFTGGIISQPMGNGIGSFAYGTFDVNDFYNINNSMGARLGDCTGTAKVFTVTQGSTVETVTLEQDYTSDTNTEVLAAINNQISSFTAELYVPMNDFYPDLPEAMLFNVVNNGTEDIAVGYGVVMLSDTSCRIATSADTTDIAISADYIPVGGTGRIVYRNRFSFYQLYEFFAGFPTDNQELGIRTGVNGQFAATPTNASLRADGTVGLEFIAGYTPSG